MNVRANVSADFPSERELVLERIFDAPREKVYRAWTEPKLLKQWFVPRPWTISGAETFHRIADTFVLVGGIPAKAGSRSKTLGFIQISN